MKQSGYKAAEGEHHEPNLSIISQEIEKLLERRGHGKTICPSEVARQIDDQYWRDYLEDVHHAVVFMVEKGLIRITQKGKEVDPLKRKGAYRIKKV